MIQRVPPVVAQPAPYAAVFEWNWLTASGTSCFLATIAAALLLRVRPVRLAGIYLGTFRQLALPLVTIPLMLALAYVMNYSGMTSTLGLALAATGPAFPFFSAVLGWLGVFLTGTDAGSNALFGSLQKITATELYNQGHLPHFESADHAAVLICTANSTGGVMGKMIDAQSICVATAGTNQIGKEADIFKAVVWHSMILASVVGLMTALQAFVPPFTLMVPKP
jgi:lactate permease